MDVIKKYFANLSTTQLNQFEALFDLYLFWNEKINVISRKDIKNLYLHHVLHSLAIAKVVQFKSGTQILDVGTGGGFPGIPLAILFPDVNFYLIDSINKKIKVVNEVVKELKLNNVAAEQKRAENVNAKFDFVVSRAVTKMNSFIPFVENNFKNKCINSHDNGILYLKGLDVTEEFATIRNYNIVYPICKFFNEEVFKTKAVVYVKVGK